jgi:ABC-type Fe3+-hydroxamate transport system substrate-binding protein
VRVVSLVPSVTETLLAWGVEVVACTRFCEQPDLIHVGGTKDPDVAAIAAIAPDLVVMDREENRLEDADALRAAGVALHVTTVRSVADVASTLQALRSAVGVDEAGSANSDSANGDPRNTDPANTGRTNSGDDGVRRAAFIPIWRRPWMTISADTYGSTVLASIGVGNVYGDHADRYPTIDLVDAARRRPDLVILPSEPYPFRERHMSELSTALPFAPVLLVDGQDLFWWGVRTEAAQRRLAAQLLASGGA